MARHPRTGFLLRPAALLLVLAAAGCSDGPKVVPVNGKLTYKGTPVTNATIHFEPEKGRMSWAQTDEEGKFKINYDSSQDGAVVGKHKVWIEPRATTRAEKEAQMQGAQVKRPKEIAEFFERYSAEKSDLTVEIKRDTKELTLALE